MSKMHTFIREDILQLEHDLMDYCVTTQEVTDATAQKLNALAAGVKMTIDAILEKFE